MSTRYFNVSSSVQCSGGGREDDTWSLCAYLSAHTAYTNTGLYTLTPKHRPTHHKTNLSDADGSLKEVMATSIHRTPCPPCCGCAIALTQRTESGMVITTGTSPHSNLHRAGKVTTGTPAHTRAPLPRSDEVDRHSGQSGTKHLVDPIKPGLVKCARWNHGCGGTMAVKLCATKMLSSACANLQYR